MNNFIQNVSWSHIITGHHADAGENSMLIQIVDFFDTFPTPKYNFKEVLQFKFDDVLDGPTACTDLQAQELTNALQRAKEQHMNVIVHCFAGLCRSGAVAEVGIMLGFNPHDCIRIPNSAVKNKMLKALGMKIDESTSVFAQEFYNREFDRGQHMNYIIVKNASQEAWHLYFDSNPQTGVHQSYSAHDTFTGQQCNIRSSYATKASAEEDLKKMLEANPSGCYAVCPMAV